MGAREGPSCLTPGPLGVVGRANPYLREDPMPRVDNPRAAGCFLAALVGAILVPFVLTYAPQAPETEQAAPAPEVQAQFTREPDPPCYEIHKFCVGLREMTEKLVDRKGQPVDDTHDGRTWRMVTAVLQVHLKAGESKGSFGSASVALIDTQGGRHINDNVQVGLERPHTRFDRQNQLPGNQTYVFLLDETEEAHCLQVSSGRDPGEICFPLDAP